MKFLFKYSAFLILIIIIMGGKGCKSRKNISKANSPPLILSDTIPEKDKCGFYSIKKQQLIDKMREAELKYTSLLLKASCSFTIDQSSEDVDMKIRILRDSLIWIHVDYLNIDIARVLITPDSLKFINYRQKKYMAEPLNVLSRIINADVDLNLLQAALVGNSAEFFQEDDHIHVINDRERCLYQISTLKKRRQRKVDEGKKDLKKILQIISLHPETFKIVHNRFQEPEQNRSFLAEYGSFSLTDSIYAPRHVNITLDVGKHIYLKLKYVRIEKNAGKILFQIPSRYERFYMVDH